MRLSCSLLAVALVGLGLIGCGGAGGRASTTSSVRYLSDGDAEAVEDRDSDNRVGAHEDTDGDSSEEYFKAHGNDSYHDPDDNGIFMFGRPANPVETQALVAVVKSYYAAAASEDGAAACKTIILPLARAVAEDYGRAPGPAYLRGGKTCEVVMQRFFKHYHAHLLAGVHVTGVRLKGNEAYALYGSTRMPAGYVVLHREAGAWKVDGLLGIALP